MFLRAVVNATVAFGARQVAIAARPSNASSTGPRTRSARSAARRRLRWGSGLDVTTRAADHFHDGAFANAVIVQILSVAEVEAHEPALGRGEQHTHELDLGAGRSRAP